MKKVFSALVLTSLLAVLVVPAMVSAIANCPYRSCDDLNPVDCKCGSATTDSFHRWCTTKMAYALYKECNAAMSGDSSGVIQDIPETSITTPEQLIGLINTIGKWIFSALLAIAVIFLVVAGFLWVTAGGNPEQTTKARQMLINALIGLAIALGAQGLKTIITNLLA